MGGSSTVSPRETEVRISIVVPHLGDDVAFEDSLLSVLENRPEDADVCVVHNGSYSDPFDLGDEVRFVRAGSDCLPDLIAAAAEAVTGRVLHVLANGVRATPGWTDAPLRLLADDPTAMVAPIVRDPLTGKVTAAGWADSRCRISEPIGSGAMQLSRRGQAAVQGPYLAASFWRRATLRTAIRAAAWQHAEACEYVWPRILANAGWRCVTADESSVLGAASSLLSTPGFRRGRLLRAAACELDGSGKLATTIQATALSVLMPFRLARSGSVAELLGQFASVISPPQGLTSVRADQVDRPGEFAETISMPCRTVSQPTARRRAA